MLVRRVVSFLVLPVLLLVVVLATSYPPPMQAAEGRAPQVTYVCGQVEGTWTEAGSPYVVTCDAIVGEGKTLTILPDVVVKFSGWYEDLVVEGTLIADATAASPITFTSLQDDTVGGDTNGDGSTTIPGPGDWSSLRFTSSSTGSVLDHTAVRYGGGPNFENVWVNTTDVTLTNNTIAYSGDHGLTFDNALPSLLSGNTIISNTQFAAYAPLTGNADSITLSGNTASDNGLNGFAVQGSVSGEATWAWGGGDTLPFVVYDDLTVSAGGTLTLAPGTALKFGGIYENLLVDGSLIADGTADSPVTFTSIKDDTVGGDTNADGATTSPAPGDWGSIQVAGDATLGGASLLYAGYGGHAALRALSGAQVDLAGSLIQESQNQAIAVSGTGKLLVSGSRIEHNQGSGVVVDGDDAWVHVSGSNVGYNGQSGNPAGGVHNRGNATVVLGGEPGAGNAILFNEGYDAYQEGTGTTMLATYNWWGDASGPYHPTLNPGGLGGEVSDRVAFTPWLSETNALPSERLVELLAPLSFSPGETFNLGVRFANVLTGTLEEVAVVMQLPELSQYVLSTSGGLYRPGEHDVIWRLGDVAPGESLDAAARIEMPWGLEAHTWFGAKALVAAANLPNPAVDLEEVLSYTAVTTVTQHYLTPAEITATLEADPELDALLQQAQALGFTFYDTALSETFSTGGELLTLVLLDRERMEQVVYVRRSGDERTILRTTPALITEYNDAGGWRYDLDMDEWSFWGEWATTTTPSSLTTAKTQDPPTNPCDPEFPKTEQDCRRNCLIIFAGSAIDFLGRRGIAENLFNACLLCRYIGVGCDACSLNILLTFDGARKQLEMCGACCEKDTHTFDCTEDARRCSRRVHQIPEWYTRVELCDLTTCSFSGVNDYEPCAAGATCVDGCCEGATREIRAGSSCGCAEGDLLQVCSTSIHPQLEVDRCACFEGTCSVRASEVRTAHDPNAKLGPAEAAAGEWLSYTVQYENLGAGTAYGVYVEDPLSPLVDDSTLQIQDGGLYFPSSRTVYWPVGELGPGAGGSRDLQVQVPTGAVSGTVIMNSATVYFPSVPETTPTGDVVTLVQDLVAHSQRVETVEGVPLAITLTGYSPVGPLTYQVVAGPGGGTLSGTPPHVVYTPASNFEGLDRFTFRVDDGLQQSWPAEVSVVVHTGAETVPPEVFATCPSRDETGVRVSATPVFLDTYAPTIYVSLSEPIDPATVTAESLFVADAQGQHLAGYTVYDAGSYTARFVSQERFEYDSTYIATVTTAVRDTSGNPLATSTVWSFTTESRPAGRGIYLPLVLRQNN